jgi:hypothetical protein
VSGYTEGSYSGQLRYDDGDADTWFLRNGAPTVDWAAAVRFSSPYERFRLLGAMLLLGDTQPFQRVLVCPDSAGRPKLGSPYFEADSVGASEPESWLELDCDTALTRDGDIWLVAFWPRRATGPRIGEDRSAPLDGRSYFGSSLTGWIQHTAGDVIARLVIDGRLGIEERPKLDAPRRTPGATVVRGVLFWGLGHNPNSSKGIGLCPAPVLLDAVGRKVMHLRPGPNDVRHLPAGVYFVRTANARVVIQN